MQQTRTRTQTKFKLKSGYKPDSAIVSAIASMRQNPKFSRLLGFAMNCLIPHLTPPNPKHRDNVNYLISEGAHQNIVRAISDHIKDDNILFTCTQILIKIIGKDKFKDEELARLVVDCGAITALMNALNDPSEKSKHTIKAIIELLNILGGNPSLAGKMIDLGVLEGTTNTLSKLNMSENIVKTGIEALQKIASHPQARQAVISRNIVKDIVALLEKKAYSPVIVQSGLKFLESVAKTKEGVEYLKKDGIGMKALVSLLEKHPEEKAILNTGANILGKVATISDLTNALSSLKDGDPKKVQFNAAIVSSLTLVDDLMEEFIKKNAVSDMIAIMNKNISAKLLSSEEQKKLIKHCAVSIGRVAEVDEKQIKDVIDKGGLETLNAALDLQDPEVIASCINTLAKLSQSDEVLPKIAKVGLIKKVLDVARTNISDERLCESTINLLENLATDDGIIEEVARNNGLSAVIKMMKQNANNKKIVENGTRTLGLLSINEENAGQIIDNGIVEFLIDTAKKHPDWRKCAFYSINLIDGLSEMEQVLPVLKKTGGLQAVISIMSGKNYDTNRFEKKDSPEESDVAHINEDEDKKQVEVLNPKQEMELKDSGLAVLEKLVSPEEIKTYKTSLEKSLKELEKSNDMKSACEVESQIATMGYLAQIPALGEQMLKDDVTTPLVDFSHKVSNLKDFEGKSNVISEMVRFFNNLSYLNTREATRDLYQKKKIGQSFVGFVNEILEKNQEPNQVVQGLKSLKAFLNQKTGDIMAAAKRGSKRVSLLDVAASKENSQMIDKMIDGIVSNMKKYPDVEEVQLNALDVFNTMSQLSPDLNASIVKMGGSRAVISKLEEELTSKKLGIQCLKLLNNLACSKKDALLLLNNQKAGEAVMSFLTNQRNDLQCSEAATPVLKLLSNAENSEFTKEIEKDIQELVQTIDPEKKKGNFDKVNAAESLEILGNFSLLEKTLAPIVKNGAIGAISNLLKHELKEDETALAEKGQLSLNERLIENCLSDLNQLVTHPQALKTKLFEEIVSSNVADSIVNALKNKSNSAKIAEKALLVANSLLNNDKCKAQLVEKLLANDMTEVLADYLEKFSDSPEISQSANQLLVNLTKASPQFATKLSQKNFVKNLIKETKGHLKDASSDEDSLKLTKQNLQCLTLLAEIGQTAEKLADEGGVDFAIAILKKENQNSTVLPEEDDYYQINLASNEQELEKKESALESLKGSELVEEKSIVANAVDLLDQMVKDSVIAQKLMNPEALKEVLLTLQANAGDKEIAGKTLQILNKAVQEPKLAKAIEENNGVNTVFCALNQHPTDPKIVQLSGEILQNIGVDSLIDQVKGQIPKLCSAFKPNNEKSVEELRKANVYLANLLTVPSPEDEAKVIASNINVIKALEKELPLSLENPELLASNLLLISRLANQGDQTKKALRDSSIPKVILKDIIPNADIMKPENGRISELALDAVNQMITADEEFINMLDTQKGKEVDVLTKDQRLDNVGKNISDTLKNNNADLLEEMLNIAELKGSTSDKPHSIRTIEKATELMAKLAKNDPSLAAALLNKGGVNKLKSLFEDLGKKNTSGTARNCPVKKVGALIGALSTTPQGFQSIVKETDMVTQIVDSLNQLKLNQDLPKDTETMLTLQEGLGTISQLVDNNFDKSDLIEAKVPECVVNVLRRLNQLPIQLITENEQVGECVKAALKTFEKLAKDPALSRILSKTDGPIVMAEALKRATDISKANKDQVNGQSDADEIIGSSELNERLIENTLTALVELSNNAKNAEKLELLNKDNVLSAQLQEIITNKSNNPVIVSSGLKIVENCLKSYDKQQLKANEELLKPLSNIAVVATKQYPKIPFIAKIAESITSLTLAKDPIPIEIEVKPQKIELNKITEELAQEAEKQQAEHKAVIQESKTIEIKQLEPLKALEEPVFETKIVTVANSTELLTKMDLVADSLDEFLKRVALPGGVLKGEEDQITKLVGVVGNFAGAASGKVAQLHNMGVTDSLLNIVASDNVSDQVKQESIDALSKLTKDEKLLDKMSENDKLASTIAKALFDAGKKKLNPLQKGIIKSTLEAAGNLANNPEALAKFLRDGGIKAIIELMQANKDDHELLAQCADALAKLTVNEDAIKEIIDLKGIELISELYKKFPNLLDILRAFAALVAKLATNELARNKLGEADVQNIIIGGIKLFEKDVILGINSCLALANLCYGHQKNSEILTKTPIVTYGNNYIINNMNEAELISNLCALYNSLGYKNSPNKKELGKMGVMDQLQKVFDSYTSQKDLKMDTLKNCFKAIGNISLFLDNSTKIIRAGFVKSACQFIRANITIADLVKFALDIFANMASFPEEVNDLNLNEMVNQGAIDTILYCIQENSLNSEVLMSSINALDFFCMNKSIRLTVAEKDGTAIVVKILKSQDWNKEIVVKCLRILINLGSAKENLEILLKNKVHQTAVDIMVVQKKEEGIILQCLKIIAKLAIDKPFCKLIYPTGFVGAAYSAFEESPNNMDNVVELFGILANLARFCEDASEDICQRGASTILQTTNSKINDIKLITKASYLIENLLKIQRNADLIIQNGGIDILNKVLDKYPKDEEIDLSSFKGLSNIALTNEEYRKMCVDKKCVDFIKKIIETPGIKDLVISEGKLTISNILAQKTEVPPEELIDIKKVDSKVSKEIKNFLVAGKICKVYKKNGSSKEMHVFMTPDLKELMAKRPKGNAIKQQWRLPIHQIKETKFDYKDKNAYNQSVFAKSGGLFTKKADAELCISLIGPVSLEGQRVLHIECGNLMEKKKWIEGIAAVLEDYKKLSKHKN